MPADHPPAPIPRKLAYRVLADCLGGQARPLLPANVRRAVAYHGRPGALGRR